MSSPLQPIADFALGFANQRPIYQDGVKIGYWRNLDELCKGKIFLSVGAQNSKPEKWVTKNDWWQDVPVTSFCVGKALKPVWVTDAELTQYQVSPPIIMPPVQSKDFIKYAAIGGLGVAAILLVLRR